MGKTSEGGGDSVWESRLFGQVILWSRKGIPPKILLILDLFKVIFVNGL